MITAGSRLAEISNLLVGETRIGLDVETEWRTQELALVQDPPLEEGESLVVVAYY